MTEARMKLTLAGITALFAAIVVVLHILTGLSLWWLLAAPALTFLGLALGGLLFAMIWMSSGGH